MGRPANSGNHQIQRRFALISGLGVIALFLSALRLFAHDGHEAAVGMLSERISDTPSDVDLLLRRAEIHREQGEWEAAEADYRRATELDPSRTFISVAYGRMLAETGRFDEATELLATVTDAHPIQANRIIAQVFRATGRPADAAIALKAAIANSSTPSPELYLNCADALSDAEKPHEAVALLDHLAEQLGDSLQITAAALDIELEQRNYEAALSRLETLIAASPRPENWLMRRGETLEHLEKPTDALAAYKEAKAALQKLPPARRHSAATTAIEEQVDRAVAQLMLTVAQSIP